jgi:hypothetical protein
MSEKISKKGISFVPSNDLTAEAKLKLESLMKKKDESLNKLVEGYRTGDFVIQ